MFFDVDADALASSVRNAAGGDTLLGQNKCKEKPSGVWYCGVTFSNVSGGAQYRVTLHGLGCWDADRQGRGYTKEIPAHVSGCVDMADIAG